MFGIINLVFTSRKDEPLMIPESFSIVIKNANEDNDIQNVIDQAYGEVDYFYDRIIDEEDFYHSDEAIAYLAVINEKGIQCVLPLGLDD